MLLMSQGVELSAPTVADSARIEPSLAGVDDFLALMKPRVMSLVVFTALVGLLVAPGHLHPVLGVAALICIAVGAGAAGALNMWYDADIDALMARTAQRPIPAGRVSRGEALGFGVTLASGSVRDKPSGLTNSQCSPVTTRPEVSTTLRIFAASAEEICSGES